MSRFSNIKLYKTDFILFTAELHRFLIKEGFTTITTLLYIPDNAECYKDSNGLDGYAILTDTLHISGEDGKWEKVHQDQIMVQKHERIPKDPDNPEEHIEHPESYGKLKMFVPCDGKPYNEYYWWEEAGPGVKVTDSMVEFPIRSERLREMYAPDAKDEFYLILDRNASKEKRLLWRKIKSGMVDKPKGRNLRKI